mmetsp:Transcript_50409/g.133953  ORF Transcript_50409/g.133953 Transcript_50409/m.133953 type:complete len:108 (+) Transcript_50409:1270-1593(+)
MSCTAALLKPLRLLRVVDTDPSCQAEATDATEVAPPTGLVCVGEKDRCRWVADTRGGERLRCVEAARGGNCRCVVVIRGDTCLCLGGEGSPVTRGMDCTSVGEEAYI